MYKYIIFNIKFPQTALLVKYMLQYIKNFHSFLCKISKSS